MTNIQANNRNKTTFNVSYNHDLPYKKSIRPDMSYGEWIKNSNITLIKVNLEASQIALLENPMDIEVTSIYEVEDEFWLDLGNVYLIVPNAKPLSYCIKNNKFLIAFLANHQLLSSVGYTQ